jgi:ComF family protein
MANVLIDSLLKLLFPDRCIQCKRMGELLCSTCCQNLKPYPFEPQSIAGLEAVHIAFVFEGVIRPAIHHLKYYKKRRIGQLLGDMLGDFCQAEQLSADAIIPVPLHHKRKQERGFNQSELLAEQIAKLNRIPLLLGGVERIKVTEQQAHLDAAARRRNMQGAFAWKSKQSAPKRILLIDDVLTTGATMAACADVLHQAGCQQVRGVALARSRPGQS